MPPNQVRSDPRQQLISRFLLDSHYRDLLRRNLMRLFVTYLAPLIALTAYFHFQYRTTWRESRELHLKSIAEYQAHTLDMFLGERVTNLANLIDDSQINFTPAHGSIPEILAKLRSNSDTFIDVGVFDSSGVQRSYAGPHETLKGRDYSAEKWFVDLPASNSNFIITDIYLGLRNKPHFTIAVCGQKASGLRIVRASLDPDKLYEYITSMEQAKEVFISIVNQAGFYQLVTPHIGSLLETSAIIPPKDPPSGIETIPLGGKDVTYAYYWLKRADWAVIVQWNPELHEPNYSAAQARIVIISLLIIGMISIIIIIRAWRLVQSEQEKDRVRGQLEHAAKLAAVGELAAGIAHEINNPLAIISEEVGLIKDLMDPQFGREISSGELLVRFDTIQDAVFRCRDITRKLLFFVRKSSVIYELHDPNALIDEVIVGLLGQEMRVNNIEIIRDYESDLPPMHTDRNQFQQVLINLLNNAVDAIDGPGSIMVSTAVENEKLIIAVVDTGKGMTADQLEKIFLPFYTTKEVGKGTGLGLSVSYEIIKSMGGNITVVSAPGKGSEFTITLPLK